MKRKALIMSLLAVCVFTVAAYNRTQHEVVIVSGYPDYPNNWDWTALTLTTSVVTKSSGAPDMKYGSNYAQTIADLLNQGYTLQGAPHIDDNGYGTTAVLVK